MPSFELRYAVSDHPVASHSREMSETATTELAFSNAIAVAKSLSLTACDFLENPELLAAARAEFEERSKAYDQVMSCAIHLNQTKL